MREQLTHVQQSSTSIEVLSWRVGILDKTVKEAGLVEMMRRRDTVTEDLIAIRGNWDEASVKLVTQNKNLETVRAQLLREIQELETKVHNEQTFLENQSGQVEKTRTSRNDLQSIQSKLVDVISKFQDNVIESKDLLQEASEGAEELPVAESTPAPAGP